MMTETEPMSAPHEPDVDILAEHVRAVRMCGIRGRDAIVLKVYTINGTHHFILPNADELARLGKRMMADALLLIGTRGTA